MNSISIIKLYVSFLFSRRNVYLILIFSFKIRIFGTESWACGFLIAFSVAVHWPAQDCWGKTCALMNLSLLYPPPCLMQATSKIPRFYNIRNKERKFLHVDGVEEGVEEGYWGLFLFNLFMFLPCHTVATYILCWVWKVSNMKARKYMNGFIEYLTPEI